MSDFHGGPHLDVLNPKLAKWWETQVVIYDQTAGRLPYWRRFDWNFNTLKPTVDLFDRLPYDPTIPPHLQSTGPPSHIAPKPNDVLMQWRTPAAYLHIGGFREDELNYDPYWLLFESGPRTPPDTGQSIVSAQSDSKIVALLRPLLPSIVETLESASVPWTWFTGIRIGYRSGSGPALSLDDQYPAVVLINVEYGTTIAQVSAATRVVKNILERNRLDIHVEVRENSIWNHTAISNASQHSTIPNLDEVVKDEYWALYSGVQKRANEEPLPLLSTLGWEVSKTATKEYRDYGTSGVFLTFDGVNDLFATTCYHVHLPQKERPTIIKAQSNAAKPKVSQASPKTVSVALKLTIDILEGYRKSSADALEKVKRYDDWRQSSSSSGPEPEEPTPEERKIVATVKYLRNIVDAVTTVYEDNDSTGQIKPGSGLLKRVIGSISAAPEYEVCNSQGSIQSTELVGFLNDWCLIKLDGTRFKKASNKLYLGVDRAPAFTKIFFVDSDPKLPIVPKMEELDREKFEKYVASNGGFLPRKGYLEGTLETPTAKGKSSIPSVRVAKRGATTGLTFRETNSIEACVREKVVIKGVATKSACSWELLVIPFPDQLSETTSRTRFSEKGDSG
ncbi:hypothetical protein PG988_014776 [Apiospora saccharicola]